MGSYLTTREANGNDAEVLRVREEPAPDNAGVHID